MLTLCCIVAFVMPYFGKDYKVIDFGAVGDGVTLNTEAIQSAIDHAHKQGDSKVIIPEGAFLTGSIHLLSGVELHIAEGAVLLGSVLHEHHEICLLYTSPSPRDATLSRMPSSA